MSVEPTPHRRRARKRGDAHAAPHRREAPRKQLGDCDAGDGRNGGKRLGGVVGFGVGAEDDVLVHPGEDHLGVHCTQVLQGVVMEGARAAHAALSTPPAQVFKLFLLLALDASAEALRRLFHRVRETPGTDIARMMAFLLTGQGRFLAKAPLSAELLACVVFPCCRGSIATPGSTFTALSTGEDVAHVAQPPRKKIHTHGISKEKSLLDSTRRPLRTRVRAYFRAVGEV